MNHFCIVNFDDKLQIELSLSSLSSAWIDLCLKYFFSNIYFSFTFRKCIHKLYIINTYLLKCWLGVRIIGRLGLVETSRIIKLQPACYRGELPASTSSTRLDCAGPYLLYVKTSSSCMLNIF